MPVRPTSAASAAKNVSVRRSPFEVTDPELVKQPALRRVKANTPITAVKKGTKELDAAMGEPQTLDHGPLDPGA